MVIFGFGKSIVLKVVFSVFGDVILLNSKYSILIFDEGLNYYVYYGFVFGLVYIVNKYYYMYSY